MSFISTGSVCTFPFAFPTGDALSSNNSADCTVTYAQRIGSDYDALQGVYISVFLVALLAMTVRLFQLHRYATSLHKKLWELPSFWFFFFAFMFNLCGCIEAFDLFAYRAWYVSPAVYFIFDEMCAGSLVGVGVSLVDFWVRIARGIGNSRHGLSPYERIPIIIAFFVNFIGFELAGILNPEYYVMWEMVKSFGASLLVFLLIVRGGVVVAQLRQTLISSTNSNEVGGENNVVKKRSRMAIQTLIRKYALFTFIAGACMLGLLINGIIIAVDDTRVGWASTILVTQPFDDVQIALRVLYMVTCILLMFFFNIPKTKQDTPSNTGSNTAPDGTATTRDGARGAGLLSSVASSFRAIINPGGSTASKHTKVASSNNRDSHQQAQSTLYFAGGDGLEAAVVEER